MSRKPCPHCGEIQYGPVQGIGYYCSQGSKCPGITFAKPDTITITISREDADTMVGLAFGRTLDEFYADDVAKFNAAYDRIAAALDAALEGER